MLLAKTPMRSLAARRRGACTRLSLSQTGLSVCLPVVTVMPPCSGSGEGRWNPQRLSAGATISEDGLTVTTTGSSQLVVATVGAL